MIRVMVVHPSPLANKATTQSLKLEHNIRVIDSAFTAGEARAKLSADNCDVVLISASLPLEGALKLTRMLHHDYPALKPVIVGLPEEQDVVLQYIGAGAAAYVADSSGLPELIETIHAVVRDEAKVSPSILMALMRRVADLNRLCRPARNNPTVYATLTDREQEIMELLAQGLSNQVIAEHLSVEVGTVKNHVHRILKKLNVRNRQEAAGIYAVLAPEQTGVWNPA